MVPNTTAKSDAEFRTAWCGAQAYTNDTSEMGGAFHQMSMCAAKKAEATTTAHAALTSIKRETR